MRHWWVRWAMGMNRAKQLEDRCRRLAGRGLDDRLVMMLWQAGSSKLIAKVEVRTEAQIRALNRHADRAC